MRKKNRHDIQVDLFRDGVHSLPKTHGSLCSLGWTWMPRGSTQPARLGSQWRCGHLFQECQGSVRSWAPQAVVGCGDGGTHDFFLKRIIPAFIESYYVTI
jgi:hypothetical protein